jgi:hypothetical protein
MGRGVAAIHYLLATRFLGLMPVHLLLSCSTHLALFLPLPCPNSSQDETLRTQCGESTMQLEQLPMWLKTVACGLLLLLLQVQAETSAGDDRD